jgi:hypothetical protein
MTDETMALTAAVNYQLGRACSLGAQHNALCGSATAEEVSDMFTEGKVLPDNCDCRISRLRRLACDARHLPGYIMRAFSRLGTDMAALKFHWLHVEN